MTKFYSPDRQETPKQVLIDLDPDAQKAARIMAIVKDLPSLNAYAQQAVGNALGRDLESDEHCLALAEAFFASRGLELTIDQAGDFTVR